MNSRINAAVSSTSPGLHGMDTNDIAAAWSVFVATNGVPMDKNNLVSARDSRLPLRIQSRSRSMGWKASAGRVGDVEIVILRSPSGLDGTPREPLTTSC